MVDHVKMSLGDNQDILMLNNKIKALQNVLHDALYA